jgi:hypothetical protein
VALGELFKLKPLLAPLGPNAAPLQQFSTATAR